MKKTRFELETKNLTADVGVQVLKQDFDFQIISCCNISANGEKRNKDALKRTLMFMVVDPQEKVPVESRQSFKACEYEFIRQKLSDDLDKMVGGVLTIFKGTMYMKNCFLLSSSNCAVRAPEGVFVRALEEKPNVRVQRYTEDDRSNLDEFASAIDEELSMLGAPKSNSIALKPSTTMVPESTRPAPMFKQDKPVAPGPTRIVPETSTNNLSGGLSMFGSFPDDVDLEKELEGLFN